MLLILFIILTACAIATLVMAAIHFSVEITFIQWLIVVSSVLIGGVVAFVFIQIVQNIALPRSYAVAIVGFPKSGKTTLLISLFGEAFAGNIEPVKISPAGSKTIERVNTYLERIRKGKALGPTKDQDRFAFRASLTVKRFLISRKYKVEFGDFPGDDSLEYSTQKKTWLHETEFFKWVIDSDAIIFVVDIGRYLLNAKARRNYVMEITTSFRAAWQYYVDIHAKRIKEVVRHPLVLAFSKADLFGVEEEAVSESEFENEIAKLGFGKVTPPIKEIDPEALRRGQDRVKDDFSELIQYFEEESKKFHVLFCSSFGLLNGKRLGINELLLTSMSY